MLLTIFNKEIFKNIWNVSKKLVSLQCNKERDINNLKIQDYEDNDFQE